MPNTKCKEAIEETINELLQMIHQNGTEPFKARMYPHVGCASGWETKSTACRGDSGGYFIKENHFCTII